MTSSYDSVWSIAVVEADSKLAFVGRESGAIDKRELAKDVAALVVTGHTGAVTGIVAASGDEITTCSTDGTLRTWNTAAELENPQAKRETKNVRLPAGARCMLQSGESLFVGLSNGQVVRVDNGAITATLKGHADAVVALAASDTAIFSASYDRTIRGWDLASNAAWFVFRGHEHHVKGVAVVNGTSLVSCGRDDTVCVWNIPAEGPAQGGGDGGGAAAGNAQDGDDGAAPDAAAAAAAPAGSADAAPLVVRPSGVVSLPATPHALALIGVQLVVACADGSVHGFASKALLKAVADYSAAVDASCAQAVRTINNNTAIKIKNAKRVARRTVKQAKQQILEEEAAAKGTSAPPPPAADAEGDEDAAAADAGEDETGAAALSPEGQARLDQIAAEAAAAAEKATAAAQSEKAAQLAKLAPLRGQRFTQGVKAFAACPYATTFRGPQSEPAVVLCGDGAATAVVSAGATVFALPLRVGVLAL